MLTGMDASENLVQESCVSIFGTESSNCGAVSPNFNRTVKPWQGSSGRRQPPGLVTQPPPFPDSVKRGMGIQGTRCKKNMGAWAINITSTELPHHNFRLAASVFESDCRAA